MCSCRLRNKTKESTEASCDTWRCFAHQVLLIITEASRILNWKYQKSKSLHFKLFWWKATLLGQNMFPMEGSKSVLWVEFKKTVKTSLSYSPKLYGSNVMTLSRACRWNKPDSANMFPSLAVSKWWAKWVSLLPSVEKEVNQQALPLWCLLSRDWQTLAKKCFRPVPTDEQDPTGEPSGLSNRKFKIE